MHLLFISGEGMAGALYWQDLITLMKETGFSTPHLVAGSHIVVHNPELQQKIGKIFVSPGIKIRADYLCFSYT